MASYVKNFTRIPIVDDSDESINSDCSVDFDGNKRSKSSSRSSQDDEMAMMRRPTRRPDPTVTNRNALMARENRRRQKERLERLEEENQHLTTKNCTLQHKLKAKDQQMRVLEREYKYLKSIIANQTPIIEILNTIKKTKMPISSSFETFVTSGKSPATESTASASSGYASPNLNQNEHDYELDTNALATEPWNENEIFSGFQMEPDFKADVAPSNVKNEHSYSDPGVCVHISNQRVSIEFCGKCNSNAADGWLEH